MKSDLAGRTFKYSDFIGFIGPFIACTGNIKCQKYFRRNTDGLVLCSANLVVAISCREPWQFEPFSNTIWLQLLLPFTAVKLKTLCLCKEFVYGIAAALQELVWGRATEEFLRPQNIYVEGLLNGVVGLLG